MPYEVVHRTVYRYDAPVRLGPHRMLLRPRDSHDLRLLDASLAISPEPTLVWRHDVFGNSVCHATFDGETTELSIESRLVIEHWPRAAARGDFGRSARYPFAYDADDRADLGALTAPERPEDAAFLRAWIGGRLGDASTAGLTAADLLTRLCGVIHDALRYEPRDAYGTQTARRTLESGAGTCRDYAMAMIEAARALGFGARFVTGYIHSPALDPRGPGGSAAVGAAATHAWAQVYDPGEGWLAFDPTNDRVEGAGLIRVATVRAPRQASPVSGSYAGAAKATLDVDVTVADAPA